MRLFASVILAGLTVTLLATPMRAETPLDGRAFERYAAGKTLYFGMNGAPYGVEKYLDNRRVRWSFLDGRCLEGRWYEAENRQICFVYEDDPEAHCWQFFLRDDGLVARLGGDPDVVPLYEAAEQDDPMLCLGPEIGV